MKTLIYGGGAVGLGIASCLIQPQIQVDIIGKEDTVSSLKTYGLIRKGIFGDFYAKSADFNCYLSLSEIPGQVYEFILVSTKSYDSLKAARDLQKHTACLSDTTRIILFQNGWGNAEIFSEFFPRERIFNARVITGFIRPAPNEVCITVHADAIHIGSLFGVDAAAIEELCRAITKGGIPCSPTDRIEEDLWAKMLYNCALNPLGAILNVPYGILAKNSSTRFIMDRIVEEVFQVFTAGGYKTHWKNAGDFLDTFYGKLVPDTAEHKSSTLHDINAKKQTEIEALNGAVLNLAQKYHIDVPYNQSLYHLIKFKEPNSEYREG